MQGGQHAMQLTAYDGLPSVWCCSDRTPVLLALSVNRQDLHILAQRCRMSIHPCNCSLAHFRT